MLTDDFDYTLPPSLIAQSAREPRDAALLLDADTMETLRFSELALLFNPGDILVVNNTRVRAARLRTRRLDTGGAIEVLLTRRVDEERWEVLLRPSRRLRKGSEMEAGPLKVTLQSDPVDGVATATITGDGDIEQTIKEVGEVPLPPYFHGHLDDPDRYQTMFASVPGSSAAPTAALHFTTRVVDSLLEKGVEIVEVELEVGLDTFRPMSTMSIEDHRIHTERISVSAAAADRINAAKGRGGRVVAVGTTVVRTLESAAEDNGRVAPFDGPTSLYITPGYNPRIVDAIITNFHAPRTTLLVLLGALVGDRWRDIYSHAAANNFRFLSFGDAMFATVNR
ncbi:MAG: tRNA preQ1(34) S-adenosylmethionine ribosyltransferase-isomerase QueA [Acidimicrobiia bacterium]